MILERIAAARERGILSHAKSCLASGESIEAWVRIRHPEHRGSGFIYLSPHQCIVYWSGIASNPIPIPMDEVRSWGVDRSSDKGPVLGIETESSSQFVQLIVGTDNMVEKVNAFLEKFQQYAPEPHGPLEASSHPSDYESEKSMKVAKERKSFTTHSRRVLFTVLGVLILVVGVVLLFAPGPGILVVLLGLSILAREYDWAQDILHWARLKYHNATERFKQRRSA